jgi:prevent-host-death family protein
MKRHLSAAKVRSDFAEVVNQVAYGKDRVAVTRNGKEIVALVPIEDLELLRSLEDKVDLNDARSALKEAKSKGTKSWTKIKSAAGL